MQPPPCANPVASPATDLEVRQQTIRVMERLNMFGVLSGSPEEVADWGAAAPSRFIPGLAFRIVPGAMSPDRMRALVTSGAVEVLAEVTNQYEGIAPDDERMEPYWALAEELDLPVGLHMGPGPPGVSYLADPRYRASLSSALLLEDVLVRHPRLRVYIMHAGFPLVDDLLALLYAHPQVYVELGVVVFTRPRADLYDFLERVMNAGFGDRVMFGSDQMNWPGVLEPAVQVIVDAPFLSEGQRRDILYNNAARFLRLTKAEQDIHWRR